MSRMDIELEQYKNSIGDEEYRRQYCKLYVFARDSKLRHSGKEYTNTQEKLQSLKEKYKNGVSIEQINQMVNNYG